MTYLQLNGQTDEHGNLLTSRASTQPHRVNADHSCQPKRGCGREPSTRTRECGRLCVICWAVISSASRADNAHFFELEPHLNLIDQDNT
jgi:hypothetical protein